MKRTCTRSDTLTPIETSAIDITIIENRIEYGVYDSNTNKFYKAVDGDPTKPSEEIVKDSTRIKHVYIVGQPNKVYTSFRSPELISVTMPDARIVVNKQFSDCSRLETVVMPKVETIEQYAFSDCKALKSIDLSKVKSIGQRAFYGCYSFVDVKAPILTDIEAMAFYRTGIEKLYMPSLKEIDFSVFGDCSAMTTAVLPKLENTALYMFMGCKSLTTALMSNVKGVFSYAFWRCPVLTTVEVPKAENISAMAFEEDSTFDKITFGAIPPVAEMKCFRGCPTPRYVTIMADKENEAEVLAAYKAVEDGDTTDNLWYGWTIPTAVSAPKPITAAMVTDIAPVPYTGEAIQPEITVMDGETRLTPGIDYTVSYSSNTAVGKAKVTVTGITKYSGKIEKEFQITKVNSQISTVETFNGDKKTDKFTYGETITFKFKPEIKKKSKMAADTADFYFGKTKLNEAPVKMDSDKFSFDYDTSKKFVPVGAQTITVSYAGNDNLMDSQGTASVTIATKELTVTVTADDKIYDGTTDATAKYELEGTLDGDVVEAAGTAAFAKKDVGDDIAVNVSKITLSGADAANYKLKTDSAKTKAAIKAKEATLKVADIAPLTYTGKALTPDVTVTDDKITLKLDADYTVAYEDNKNAGTATAVVTGKGNYKGEVSKEFTINKAPGTAVKDYAVPTTLKAITNIQSDLGDVALDGKGAGE